MKVSRILSVFLAIVMLCGCFAAFPVSAEGTVKQVYVSTSGDDSNDGAEETPVKTINQAIILLKADKTPSSAEIILKDNITTSANVYIKEVTYPITIKGAKDGIYLILGNSFACEDATIVTFDSSLTIIGKGNSNRTISNVGGDLTIDSEVLAKGSNAGGVESTCHVNLEVAAFKGDSSESSVRTVVNNGTYGDVYALGHKYGNDSKDATVSGNAYVEINNDVIINYFAFVGTNQNVTLNGNYEVRINGGTIKNFRDVDNNTTTSITSLLKIEGHTTLKICGQPSLTFNKMSKIDCFSFGESGFGEATNDGTTGIWYAGGFVLDTCGFDGEYDTLCDPLKKSGIAIWSTVENSIKYVDCSVKCMQTSEIYEEGGQQYKKVRFIIGVRDYQKINTATVKIVAKNENAEVASKDGFEITKVYDSVLATVNGNLSIVTASDIGANYIMAITVEDIPVGENITEFQITPKINGEDAPMKSFTYSAS